MKITDPLAKGLVNTRFYKSWQMMWGRCTNPNADNWDYYGGKGVTVCERWKSFEAFTADMYPSYVDGLTIERLDRDGSYCRENCCWKTQREQNVNKSSNRFFAFRGRTQTISQWAEELGFDYFALRSRLDRGWTVERALTSPVMSRSEVSRLGAQMRWHGGRGRPTG